MGIAAADQTPVAELRRLLREVSGLEFAALIGSRARGDGSAASDWDLAVQWVRGLDWLERLGRTETLRREVAGIIGVPESRVDVVDVPGASLAMRAVVAEEGIPLHGEDDLPWLRFLSRTWRELEDFYWQEGHAA